MNHCPIQNVRSSCLYVAGISKHVQIASTDVLKSFSSQFSLENQNCDWDSNNWHYCADANIDGPLTCQYIFVLDCLNFCFWPSNSIEYDVLALRLKQVLEHDENAFNADQLQNLSKSQFLEWFDGISFPLLDERLDRLHELGYGLSKFDGLAANVVKASSRSCSSLVEILLSNFPGFRDTSVYGGRLIHFYKRAQILCGDVWAAYRKSSSSTSPYKFEDIDKLTMFADYRVPQILRHHGILNYSSELASKVDLKEEILFGSPEETEIRACTVIAVEQIQLELIKQGRHLLVLELDWLLWQVGEKMKSCILPHHRTLTIYY